MIKSLATAPDEASARRMMNDLWLLWSRAPDAAAQQMLDHGMSARSDEELDNARAAFDALVAYCPAYPEGYNQRAFTEYLTGDYAAALADLDRVLQADPDHIAALSGKAIVLAALGRHEESQSTLAAAVALNPFLPERALLQVKP